MDKCSKWSMSMKKTYSEDKKLFLDNLTILLSSKLSPLADSWPILQEKTKSTTSAPITETWNEQTHSCSRQQHNVKARCRRKQSSIKRLRNESGWSNGSSLKKRKKKKARSKENNGIGTIHPWNELAKMKQEKFNRTNFI